MTFKIYHKDFHNDLLNLARKTWEATYKEILSQDQINYMLDMMYNADKIEEQILEGQIWELIFHESNLLGFIHYYSRNDVVILSKIYVSPDHWGAKLSGEMLKKVEDYAIQKNITMIELTVNKNNLRAQRFYEKNGFVNEEEAIFNIGNGYIMDDFIYRKILN